MKMADWLGTMRVSYSYTGGSFSQSGAHAPFGESYSYNGGYPMDFTGQQNDGNMVNTTYYFPERQLRSSQGRWLSPDPAGLAAVNFANPQSWNRYAYVANNPLAAVDPNGLKYNPAYFAPRRHGFGNAPGCGDGDPSIDVIAYGGCDNQYFVNGAEVPPWVALGLLGNGVGVQCPQNECGPVSMGGILAEFKAYSTGTVFVPFAGPGSSFDTNNQALVAGALNAENQSLLNDGNEQCGMTYGSGDSFTYTAPIAGSHAGCQPLDAIGQIPAGDNAVGGYHSHGAADPNYADERFSGQPGDNGGDAVWSGATNYPLSLATPGGRVMVYYPGSGCQAFFQGTPFGTGTTIPTCQ